MNIGQKIQVSEKIMHALDKMKCPEKIQAHQIQGLDYPKLYPIFQWLVNLVMETRQFRQQINNSIAEFKESNVYKHQEEEELQRSKSKLKEIFGLEKRIMKNIKINNFIYGDPLRIYSSLMEYGDKQAALIYERLCAIISGKYLKSKSNQNQNQKGKEEGKDQMSRSSIAKRNSEAYQKNLAEINIFGEEDINLEGNSEESSGFMRIERRNSVVGLKLKEVVMQNKVKIVNEIRNFEERGDDKELEIATLITREKEKHEQEIIRLNNIIEKSDEAKINNLEEIEKLKKRVIELNAKFNESKKNFEEMNSTIKKIQETISYTRDVINPKKKHNKSIF